MRYLALALLLGWLACTDSGPPYDYPRDDQLRFNQLQGRGTHNSYHIEPPNNDVDEWRYSHEPLDVQLSAGVRQFELDLNVNVQDDRFEVYHFIRADDQTTCLLFTDCLRTLKRWSDHNRGHHPMVIMLELKDNYDPGYEDHFFELFESELGSVWPRDRLITPGMIQGDHASLGEAVAGDGWPTLGELRGRALFFLLADADHITHYTHDNTSLRDRLAFIDSSVDSPFAAVGKVDDPIGGADQIARSLDANMVIRTRVDTVGTSGPTIDQARLDAALDSGAQFLSSDDKTMAIPGGTPSRCNPVTAPTDCVSTDIENPEFIE